MSSTPYTTNSSSAINANYLNFSCAFIETLFACFNNLVNDLICMYIANQCHFMNMRMWNLRLHVEAVPRSKKISMWIVSALQD